MPTQRYKLTIAYRGTRYHGWQQQTVLDTFKGERPPPGQGLPTIQKTLARVMGEVIGHPVTLSGSSRTDAGVHAKGQIAHFDTDQLQVPPEGLRRAVNYRLPSDILLRSIEPVDPSFDSITWTTGKRYQYFIWNHLERAVFFADLAWHRWQPLDRDAMAEAAQVFVGEHDFLSFARPRHGRESTIRDIHVCRLTHRGPKMVIGIEGNGFLWNMIRIMVGTIVEVGLGHFGPEVIQQMLDARDRRAAGATAPPHGLYLQWIKTPGGGTPLDDEPD